MKASDVAKRLKREFPNMYVSFVVEATVFGRTDNAIGTGCSIYTHETGHIECDGIENGILLLKEAIGTGNIDAEMMEAE